MGIFDIIESVKKAEQAFEKEVLSTTEAIGQKEGRVDSKSVTPQAPEIVVPAVGTIRLNSSLRCSAERKTAGLPEGFPQGLPLSRSSAARQSINSSSTGSADQMAGSCRSKSGGTAEIENNFLAAWPWLQANLLDLVSVGWTRRSLFQRGKNKYPAGQWGVAWIPVWRKNELSLALNQHTGAIAFHFRGTDGRPVTQTAHPQQAIRVSE